MNRVANIASLPKLRYSPADLISELERELKMRQNVYPNLVKKGTLTEFQSVKRREAIADVIAVMHAIFAEELAAERLV